MSDEDLTRIGVLFFSDVEELDAVGPWEVLSYWTWNFPEDGYGVVSLSPDGEAVSCAKGLRVLPDVGVGAAPSLEVLVHPGGLGARARVDDEEHLAWLRSVRAEVPVLVSVCTGSLVYAAAGLLSGREATTHWAALERLAELDSSVTVRGDERFVDEGDVVTSAGVSAGVDMALHLVARFAGQQRAQQVRRGIQYDPQPPV